MGFNPGTGLGKDGQGSPLQGISRPAHAMPGSVSEHTPSSKSRGTFPCLRRPPQAMEVTHAVDVRTRSRAAAVAKRTRRPLLPSPLTAAAADLASADGSKSGGSSYLKLRSRMLFMAPPLPSNPEPAHDLEAGYGGPLPAGLSRCSSTASSVDASSAA
ncbi:hypothetical protein ACQ4PT_063389 [Festuca glaucescens]